MSRKLKALVCVAHPDDETLFFGGLIASRKFDWTAVCVTDANADGFGAARQEQFRKACKKLGIKKSIALGQPDIFEQRLNIDKLKEDLAALGPFDQVFTHGILGEYGHKHHQDVSYATHLVFAKKAKVMSIAYNTFPELRISLNEKTFSLKTKILWEIYAGETMRLLNLLPATTAEGFCQVKLPEIEEIYSFITENKLLNKSRLKKYRWLADYIEKRHFELKVRPF